MWKLHELVGRGFLDDMEESLRTKTRSEEHTSELQSQSNLVCRLLLEKKKNRTRPQITHREHTPDTQRQNRACDPHTHTLQHHVRSRTPIHQLPQLAAQLHFLHRIHR